MQRVGEALVGSFAGLRMDAEVVLEVDPGGEGGVQLFEGLESGALGFGLEVVLDGLVDRFDLALAVGLVGLVVELGRLELAEDPGELLGDVDRTVVQIDPEGNAPAQDQALEGVLHAGELFIEVVPAREDLAGVVVDPDEEVGFPLGALGIQPDAVAGVALNEIQGACGLEAVVGHASVFGEERISCLLRQAMLQEEAVDRAIGYLLDALREPHIDREELPQLGDGALGPLLDKGEDDFGQLAVVNPWGRSVEARHEEGL